MPTNTFPNGLDQIIASQGNLDPSADNASTAVTKINSNFRRSLVLGGTWLGAGLSWTNNKLTLANSPNQVIVGNSSYELSSEFQASGGQLQLRAVPISKLTGNITPSVLGMTNGTLLVGGTQGQGRALSFSIDDFSTAGDVFSIRRLASTAFATNSIGASKLNLSPNKIAVGSSVVGQGAVAVSLSSQFAISDGVLQIIGSATVNYSNLLTGSYINANPRFLISSLNPTTGQESLAWADVNATFGDLVTRRIAAENSAKNLYVDADTGNDSLSNRGSSKFTPFKSLNRAALEVARFNITAQGLFPYGSVTIHVTGGKYTVDNRAGAAAATVNSTTALEALVTGGLNYFNPVSGGLILPRGCSVIGLDLRKTLMVPIYVPEATSVGVTRSCIFRLTGTSYIANLGLVDNPLVLRSHHLLSGFEFVSVAELTLYYQKVQAAFAAIDTFTNATLTPNLLETQIVAEADATAVDVSGYSLIDSAAGSSPYIYNVSVRSRFGLCGAFFDGSKVTGFKSMVAAQFTIVSNQVDPAAYTPDASNVLDGLAYRTSYAHFGFKATNDAYAQLVSCFVISAARHYVVESGAELSITNSTSDFGGISLFSTGNSPTPLTQDTGYTVVRLIPPKIIEPDVRELIVGTLNPNAISDTKIGTTRILNIAPIEFINSSWIYVRIANPAVSGSQLTLGVRLAAAGPTLGVPAGSLVPNAPPSEFNIQNTAEGTDGANTIKAFIDCVGQFSFPILWFNSALTAEQNEAARVVESSRRKVLLNGANIFVQRILERRTVSERNYQFLVVVPPNAREPVSNYLLTQPIFAALDHRYYITDVKPVAPEDLTGDADCSSLTGKVYKVSILRANTPDTSTGAAVDRGDELENLNPRPVYTALLSNLDPRLFSVAGLLAASIDPGSSSYLTTLRILLSLGYTQTAADSLLTATAAGTLVQRYRCLPTIAPVVVNSAFSFDLAKPSLIRATNQTWEWVGTKNYRTGLPKFQARPLPIGFKLAALQTSTLGGRIYATGMDEEGNLYQGRNVLSLATNTSTSIRFDGLQQQPSSADDEGNVFSNLTVTGTANLTNAVVQNLKPSLIEFQTNSQLVVSSGTGNVALTDASTPAGLRPNPTSGTYGLVRQATLSEIISKLGEGYLTPAVLQSLEANYTNTGSQASVKLAGNFRIDIGFEALYYHDQRVYFDAGTFSTLLYVGVNAIGEQLRYAGANALANDSFSIKYEQFGGSRNSAMSWFAFGLA